MRELWRTIPGFQDLYRVSSIGRVKVLPRRVVNNRGYRDIQEKMLKPCKGANGYLVVNLNWAGKCRQFYVHRLVAAAFVPNPDNKREVNHKDCDKINNAVTNLEWVTSKENKRHLMLSGTYTNVGENRYNSKLTTTSVVIIRRKFESGKSRICDLAKEYNVRPVTIISVVYRKNWKHVK